MKTHDTIRFLDQLIWQPWAVRFYVVSYLKVGLPLNKLFVTGINIYSGSDVNSVDETSDVVVNYSHYSYFCQVSFCCVYFTVANLEIKPPELDPPAN